MSNYKVMQTTETGEEFCVADFRKEELAEAWIKENADNYPESGFYIEVDSGRYAHHGCYY